MTALRHTWQVALRYIRALLRQPAWVGISLICPSSGCSYSRCSSAPPTPGLHRRLLLEFLTPGVVVMLAILGRAGSAWASSRTSTAGRWTGCLVSPIWRGALNLGASPNRFSASSCRAVVIGLALVVGAHFEGGVAGVAVLVALAGLLGAVFASLERHCGADATARDADRDRHHGHAAVDLPLLGADATEPAAELDRLDRRVQPGQLGCGSRPFRPER